MGCNCKWTEIVIALVVFVMVIWPGLLGMQVSKWVAAIAAIALFLHALMCKNCGGCVSCSVGSSEMKKEEMPRKARGRPKKKK